MSGMVILMLCSAAGSIGFRLGWDCMDRWLAHRKRKPITVKYTIVERPPSGGLFISGE